ncbi:MAG: glycosyltransferase [Flavobacteriaceae bacterium]|nr:glycosyltransferase [Flavobacteriaceae bacterium]
MKRIIVTVSNDLVTDQRVHKMCCTLKEMGYDLLLIGRKHGSQETLYRDYATKRISMLFHRGFLFYAELNLRLFFLLLFTKKEVLFSNDLDTLIPNYFVAKLQRKELIFDSHELFSEIPELKHRKLIKQFWLTIERWILPKLTKVITVSDAIKKHYKNLYGIEAVVIRNLPLEKSVHQQSFPFPTENKNIILYQGAVNIGRGIELMLETIKLLDNCVLVIIGTGDIIEVLKQKVSSQTLENKVRFMGKVLPKDLKQFTPNATIGLSLEEDIGLNYRYALPNKLFDYIQAEVPVIVADLPEMKKLVETYQVGEILWERSPKSLAKLILKVISNNYTIALQKAKRELTWTREKDKLIRLLNS